jgi:hypothetical protein
VEPEGSLPHSQQPATDSNITQMETPREGEVLRTHSQIFTHPVNASSHLKAEAAAAFRTPVNPEQ